MAYVLIVDDDEDFATAAAAVLRSQGHDVHVELDTDDGKASMAKRRPDLLILDVMFPEDSSAGFEMARDLRRQQQALKNVPILMLTAVNAKFPLGFSAGDIDDAWLPVTDFLEKPVDFGVLAEKVATMVQ